MVDAARGRFTRAGGGAPAASLNYKVLWFWLLLGWTVSAADRTLTVQPSSSQNHRTL